MYFQQPVPPTLKRTYSGESHSSAATASTASSRSSSKLLFGEIALTPATSVDGRSTRSNSSICNLVLSTSSAFLRFWLNDNCRERLLNKLEKDDLPNTRLVCHDFSTRAAPHLFEDMTITFRSSSFTKPARIEALSRIGRHVKTLTFRIPHGPDTFLPPLINPETGEEVTFLYEPQVVTPPTLLGKIKEPKYGTMEMTDLLVKQYPPLFHAATNVPSFIAAFSELPFLHEIRISCPGSNACVGGNRRSTVDYALISLRIAVERAPLYAFTSLSIDPIHSGGLLYLHPMLGFGSTPSSAKRWCQIRRLSIRMEALPHNSRHSLEHLRILHAYLQTLSRSITRFSFCWKGIRGPSPLSLDREPCMQLPNELNVHPSMRGKVTGPRPLLFSRLRYMELENAVMDATQISHFINTHRRTLEEFSFEDVRLRTGDWDTALEPLTKISGNDRWKGKVEETMDIPIMLSPTATPGSSHSHGGLRVMGTLMEQEEEVKIEQERDEAREKGGMMLAKWLSRGRRDSPRKERGHIKKFFNGSMFSAWK